MGVEGLVSFLLLVVASTRLTSSTPSPISRGIVHVREHDLWALPHRFDEQLRKADNEDYVRMAMSLRAVLARYYPYGYSSTYKGQGLWATDSASLREKLNQAMKSSGKGSCRAKNRDDTILVLSVRIRGAGRFIQQWLTFYYDLGVHHVVIYIGAEYDEDGTMKALQPFIDIGFVSVHMHPGTILQHETFQRTYDLLRKKACGYDGRGPPEKFPDCPEENSNNTTQGRTIWLGGIDDDEYLAMLKEGLCVSELLASFNAERRAGAILAQWQHATSEKHDLLTPSLGSVQVRIPLGNTAWGKPFMKVITDPTVKVQLTIHEARFSHPSITTLDSLGHSLIESQHLLKKNQTQDQLWVLIHRRYPSIESAMWQWMRGKQRQFALASWEGIMRVFMHRSHLGPHPVEDTLAAQRAVLRGRG